MKHFIILDYYNSKGKVSVPIEDITSIRGHEDYVEVHYNTENICRVSNPVEEIVRRINEVSNNLNK